MLESALAGGVAAAAGDALLGGVLPTPAASILVRRLGLDLAAVISASHNPHSDNGIKFFDAAGRKLSNDAEERIEELVGGSLPAERYGRVRPVAATLQDYVRELETRSRMDLRDVRVLLDCANGATYRAAPLLFTRLGAEVETLFGEPDGTNINEGCGSTHIGPLSERMREGAHDIGFAFDGDGDRVLAVDRTGRVVDGDEIVATVAVHLHSRGELNGGVVVTVMTNFGFHRAMEDAGIEVVTTPVGDRHVVEELERRGWTLGGEQSGHVIDLRLAPSGDGIAAALLLLEALDGRDLAETEVMQKLPQRLVNVPVLSPHGLDAAELREAIDAEAAALDGRGRVLVRPSGTEPVVRVMAEAPSEEECQAVVGRVAEVVRRHMGSRSAPASA
jgi:phosphoglucosamine mutase